MDANKIEAERVLFGRKSFRHHYLPVFLIEGFTNQEGLLYIYDKKEKKILKRPRPPKSIFFEFERNSVELDRARKTSIIEDYLYSSLDNNAAKIVKSYQHGDLKTIDFKTDDTARFLFFLINLFWRIPYSDFAASDLMDRAELTTLGGDPEMLRKDPTYRKLMRTGLYKHHIEEMRKFGGKEKKWVNLHEYKGGVFVIGDNPLLFERTPREFGEFGDINFLIAISSSRIYSSTTTNIVLRGNTPAKYNAAVIHQSVRYVACGDLLILQKAVEFYDRLVSRWLQYSVAALTFK